MEKIDKILVAVDFSDYSANTLKFAFDLAENFKAELTIANIINQRDVDAMEKVALEVSHLSLEEFLKHREQERYELIQKMVDEISSNGISIKKIVLRGVPFLTLIQLIKDRGADLVVMGAKGRSNLANILFGSTAEKMFRHCPVPLLSIRHGNNR